MDKMDTQKSLFSHHFSLTPGSKERDCLRLGDRLVIRPDDDEKEYTKLEFWRDTKALLIGGFATDQKANCIRCRYTVDLSDTVVTLISAVTGFTLVRVMNPLFKGDIEVYDFKP
jgi:hypothetical protein